MRKYNTLGFTLIELMITVVILGILAAVAYPQYLGYVAESRRSDATINLSRIAALQEKFFTDCGRYAATLGAAGTLRNCANPGTLDAGLALGGATTDGHYTITAVVFPGPAPLNIPGGGGFTLAALPAGPQATADIARCNNITIDHAGLKTATGTLGNLTNGGRCWKK